MKVTTKVVNQKGEFLGSVIRVHLPSMENVLTLAKDVLFPLGVTAAAYVAIQKKIYGSGATTLIFSNEELDILKIVEFLKDFGLLIKGASETVENEMKKQKGWFLGVLAATFY